MTKRHIAILTGPDTYLDHIGVICYLMKMPMFITEESTYLSALQFYPQIQVIKKELIDLSADFLASNFDAIFESGRFWSEELSPLLNLIYKKTMRFVFCPHGNSDKGHSFKNHTHQDLSLVYGQHMIDLLTRTGAMQKITSTLTTGNYRLPFYKKYQSFYDNLVKQHVLKKLKTTKKTILYAPTWQDGENPSSFFFATEKLIKELSSHFNLIIKLHPFLEQFHPAHTYRTIGRYENMPGVIFLDKFPSIYPLLAACDLYIGDYSSIGYDFLAFDKPLYFLREDTSTPSNSPLDDCGLVIPTSSNSFDFIESTLNFNQTEKTKTRKNTYEYAFGEEKSFSVLQKEISKELS